jgi:hypothetical protein
MQIDRRGLLGATPGLARTRSPRAIEARYFAALLNERVLCSHQAASTFIRCGNPALANQNASMPRKRPSNASQCAGFLR